MVFIPKPNHIPSQMKNFAILLFLSVSLKVSAQKKQVAKRDPVTNTIEKYFVSDTNKQIREGKYERVGKSGKVIFLDGYYSSGKKTGIWNMYVFKGRPLVDMQYDYSNKKLLVFHPRTDSVLVSDVIIGNEKKQLILDRPPIYLDGTLLLMQYLLVNLRYPAEAAKKDIAGTVVIGLVITTDGKISGYTVKKSLSPECDQEAINSLKTIKGDWLPALYKNEAVTAIYYITLRFDSSGVTILE